MKEIVDKYDKSLIADLPRVLFDGKIEVIVSIKEAEKAVKYLMKQPAWLRHRDKTFIHQGQDVQGGFAPSVQ